MQRFSTSFFLCLLIATFFAPPVHADGLISKLPADGTWASFDVSTSISHANGSHTHSTGTLVVRSIGKTVINNKNYRWLEFEHSWNEEVTENNPHQFHSGITKIAIEEAVFETKGRPIDKIIAGFSSKTSAREKPDKWNYRKFRITKPGLGSDSGFGAIDHYAHAHFGCATKLGQKTIKAAGKDFDCVGIEKSETNHKLGMNVNNLESIAYRQWASDDAPFGVVELHFQELRMNGTSFEQKLKLKSIGSNAKTSLPNAK